MKPRPLPHCDTVFKTFMDPWYSESDRARKQWDATRPDIVSLSGYIGRRAQGLTVLTDGGCRDVAERIDTMYDACKSDWPTYLKVFGDLDEHWIDAFDGYYDRDRVAGVISRSDPKDFSNDYLILVCEFGAALSRVLLSKEPRLIWAYDWPYWESSLVDPQTGSVIPPFHWAVKKFSEYGLDDGYAQKIEMCVHVLNKNGE